jgi:hypothetical protein
MAHIPELQGIYHLNSTQHDTEDHTHMSVTKMTLMEAYKSLGTLHALWSNT